MPIEPFSGGLVNAGDSSLLKEGELQLTNDCTYRPQDLALWSAAGRTEFNATPLTDPLGLVYCGFDDGASVLLAQTETGLHTSPVAETGTFTEVATTVSSAPIQTVQYMNRNFLFDGTNRQVLLKDGSIRTHGMKAVETLCMIHPYIDSSHTSFWIDESINSSGGYYEYWTTEVYIDKTDGNDEYVESTFIRPEEIALIATGATGQGQIYVPKNNAIVGSENFTIYTNVEIFRPPVTNLNSDGSNKATHWNIYRSLKKDLATVGGFPTGILINEHPIPIDTLSTIDAGASWTDFHWASTVGPSNTFDTPENALGINNGTFATRLNVNSGTNILELSGYNFSNLTAPISAIEVRLFIGTDHYTPPPMIHYRMSLTGTTSSEQWVEGDAWKDIPITPLTNGYTTCDGLVGLSWVLDDIYSFSVKVYTVISQYFDFTGSIWIDAIGIRVKYGGYGDGGFGVFPAVIVEDSGAMVGRGRNGQPPISTTGDILQDRLLVNDISEPMVIRYTTPGQPDYFAEQYWLPCSTKDRDEVVCIRTLGNISIVGLKDKLFRVMFLPSENDSSFTRGDALECFSMERGIISSRGACVFQMEGQPLMLACVDQQGIYMTDGYKVYTLSDDIAWTDMVDVSDLDTCELVCNPTEFKFSLYYNPKV